jgi:microcystin-dependent protein
MSYQIDHTDVVNYGSIVVADQNIDQSTSLGFVGKNYTGYAKTISENFLHLLENFARATAPSSPVVGQLWYDTNVISNPPQPQLKIWDGTTWTAAGNVKKATSAPLASNSVIGDLWVDTANQQLYLWSGSTWILVGPQFSEGTQSGPVVETIADTLNVQHTIIKQVVGGKVVAIISKDAFVPKAALEGFSSINSGITISSTDFDGNGIVENKLWGTAEKAEALLVGSATVAASNFLRSDAPSITNNSFGIRSNAGLTLGSDLSTSLTTTENGATILYNKIDGSTIFIRVNQGGTAKDVITVSGTNVGVNKTNPIEALDVVGKVHSNVGVVVTGTENSTDLATGSIKTLGGASVTKNLYVGLNANIAGSITTGNIAPKASSVHDIGSLATPWKTLYVDTINATTLYGTFVGQLSGSVTGTASSLTSPTIFQLTGEVTSNAISFTGQQIGGVATFTTSISSDFIANKTPVTTSFVTDEFIINRPGTGVRKITKDTIFSNVATVPTGAIFPFAGSVVPAGYLLCDGSEQLIASFPELFAILGYKYKAIGALLGTSTFGLPDLRGRFPLGADNMNNGTAVPSVINGSLITTINSSADRVTDITADTIGLASGAEAKSLSVSNLPDHKHDLKGTAPSGAKGNQYYAMRNSNIANTDVDVVPHTGAGPDAANTGQYLPHSGGVDATGSLGVAVNIMNPYQTINYIIFTGRIA